MAKPVNINNRINQSHSLNALPHDETLSAVKRLLVRFEYFFLDIFID